MSYSVGVENERWRDDVGQVIESIDKVVFGVSQTTKLLLIALICNDHILLEDVPGMGKTMLSNALSSILDLEFRRVQGTPDLLPGDVSGVNIFNQQDYQFHFVAGPLFTNLLLFDEINRASPKTQSALLEAMAEGQVSIDNVTHPLPKPFLVIATQNPVEHLGTYPLPQAQLDRFLIKTKIGYPSREQEKRIMQLSSQDEVVLPRLSQEVIQTWQQEFENVYIKDVLVDKILDIVHKTRQDGDFSLGISPRSARKFVRAVKACAYMRGRDFVNKDDIFELFLPVMTHRVYAVNEGEEELVLDRLLKAANF